MAVIKEVAQLAGVSISTVSKYFNNPSGLTEPYRSRVESAVNKLNYSPDPTARGLRTKFTNSISLVVPDIANSFYSEVYNYIRANATEHQYLTQLYTTEENSHILTDLLSNLTPAKTDGIILCFLDEDMIMDQLSRLESNMPITLMSWNTHNHFNSIVLNLHSAIYRATKYLIDIGHKKIAYVSGTAASRVSQEKESGYLRAMEEAGLEIPEGYVFPGNYLFRTGYQAAKQFLSLSDPPTGIVAANDVLAIGCCKFLGTHDYKIPDDIAVTGMDGIQLSRIYDPSITTMASPLEEMCEKAVDLLLQKIKRPNSRNEQYIYDTKLVIGRSTDTDAPINLNY